VENDATFLIANRFNISYFTALKYKSTKIDRFSRSTFAPSRTSSTPIEVCFLTVRGVLVPNQLLLAHSFTLTNLVLPSPKLLLSKTVESSRASSDGAGLTASACSIIHTW